MNSTASTRGSLLLLSGGVDSALCSHLLSGRSCTASSIFVNYGQPAVRAERAASRAVAAAHGMNWSEITVEGLRVGPGEIPARNLVLLALASNLAFDRFSTIVMGIHGGTTYADCSPLFLREAQHMLDVLTFGTVAVSFPLMDLTKGEILVAAEDAGLLKIGLHSCERGDVACGCCVSCADRRSRLGV